MDIKELERLVDLVQQAAICEITLKQGNQRITIKRSPLNVLSPTGNAGMVAAEEVADTEETSYDEEPMETKTVSVRAPLVGIFTHVRPQVGVGTPVNEGQVIAQIEAMGIKNEIVSPMQGVVKEVFVEDMQPVEYDQELFLIASERP